MLRKNVLVYALWALGVVGTLILFRPTWFAPIDERDFVALWAAGKLALSGHVTQVYDTELFRVVGAPIAGKAVKLAYPYPPHALFVAVPLSLLPLTLAYVVWQTVSAGLFFIAARKFLPAGFPGFLSVLTPAALTNVAFGQVGLFYGALWLFAFGGSSFATAALTFKPHLGVLSGVEAIRRGHVIRVIAIFFLMVAASALVFGIESWRAWLSGAISHQMGDLSQRPTGLWRYQMVTPYLVYGLLGWAVFAAAAVYLLTRRFDVFTAATAAFLIAPYGFHYDLPVVSLGFGLLLYQKWSEMPAWQTFVAAVAFLLPAVIGLGSWLASPLLLAGLYVQTENPFLFDRRTEPGSPDLQVARGR